MRQPCQNTGRHGIRPKSRLPFAIPAALLLRLSRRLFILESRNHANYRRQDRTDQADLLRTLEHDDF